MKDNLLLEKILQDTSRLDLSQKIYNYHEDSPSASFYADQFVGGIKVNEDIPDLNKAPQEMRELINFLRAHIPKEAIVLELGGSKHQRRSGYPNSIFENYVPLDISYSSIVAYAKQYNRFGIVADACKLPFKDESVDVIFTHTFLEHPLKPEQVVLEIVRVLKPGGFVIHSDAWNCRWWQRYGIIGFKKMSQLKVNEKLIYIAAKITEFKLFRQSIIVLKRIFQLLIGKSRHHTLRYGKLNPNYTLHLYSDEDAASSIDPVNLMLFYEAHDFQLVHRLSFFQKIFFKDKNIYFKKKEA